MLFEMLFSVDSSKIHPYNYAVFFIQNYSEPLKKETMVSNWTHFFSNFSQSTRDGTTIHQESYPRSTSCF